MANIPSSFASWDPVAANNQPDGSDSATIQQDLQQILATVRANLGFKGANIASGATVDLSAATGNIIDVTHSAGTTAISAFGTLSAGIWKLVRFSVTGGTLTITHNATSMILPSAANITVANNDVLLAYSLGSGNWMVAMYQKASGSALVDATISDGDKGDITVSGSGATWTIDNLAVTNAKLAADAVSTSKVQDGAVNYAKLQDISATQRVLGRNTAGAGDPEEVTLSQLLDWIGSAAQGDILYRGASGWARLAAGTSGQFLKTLGAGANPAWDTVTAGGMTQIASGSLSGASVTISSIPGTYKALRLILKGWSSSTNGALILRLNGDSGSNYRYIEITGTAVTTNVTQSSIAISGSGVAAAEEYTTVIDIPFYADAMEKLVLSNTDGGSGASIASGAWLSTAAVTSILVDPAGNFDAGTYELWGIN